MPNKLHLAPAGSSTCDYGESVSMAECEAAAKSFFPNPGRRMQTGLGGTCLDGSWGQVPLGCSVQSKGDNSAHFKTDGDTGEGCISNHYQLICSHKEYSGTFLVSRFQAIFNIIISLIKASINYLILI